MKKLWIILLCVVVVLALFIGAYFLLVPREADNKPTVPVVNETLSEEDEYMDDDMSGEDVLDGDTFEDDPSEDVDDFTPDDEYLLDNTDDVIHSTFKISRVVDHTTGEEVKPRVVFGAGFNVDNNYIKFDSTGYFEIFFSGYFSETKKGTFNEHDDLIFVEYEDGNAAEYDIKYNADGIISYIVVNYGDYDVYFS